MSKWVFLKNSTSGEYILVHKTRDVYVNKIIIIMKNSTGGTYVHKTQDVYACEIWVFKPLSALWVALIVLKYMLCWTMLSQNNTDGYLPIGTSTMTWERGPEKNPGCYVVNVSAAYV